MGVSTAVKTFGDVPLAPEPPKFGLVVCAFIVFGLGLSAIILDALLPSPSGASSTNGLTVGFADTFTFSINSLLDSPPLICGVPIEVLVIFS